MSVRWVITKKNEDQKLTYKARLVARGFEELEIILEQILQPVAKRILD